MAEEEAVLHDADDALDLGLQRVRGGQRGAEGQVQDVPPSSLTNSAPSGASRGGAGTPNRSCRRACVDCQAKGTTTTGSGCAPSAGTTLVASTTMISVVGDGGDQLLAQQRAAAAFDQPKLRVHFVGPVNGHVQAAHVGPVGQGDAVGAGEFLGRQGRGDAAQAQPLGRACARPGRGRRRPPCCRCPGRRPCRPGCRRPPARRRSVWVHEHCYQSKKRGMLIPRFHPMPGKRLELLQGFPHNDLNVARIPFRHPGGLANLPHAGGACQGR